MRIALFGPAGVLGKKLLYGQYPHEIVPVFRSMYDLTNVEKTAQCLEAIAPDRIINCSVVLPLKGSAPLDMILVNALWPHILVKAAQGVPVLLSSTDRVFAGRAASSYDTLANPDATDLYGRSCAVGEVLAPNCTVARSSYISCDHGFMRWLILNNGKQVFGWKNYFWSGSVVDAIAQAMLNLLESSLRGIHHLSTTRSISKYDLACKIAQQLGLDIEIVPTLTPIYNYTLKPTVGLPPIDEVLNGYQCRDASNRALNGKETTVREQNADEGTIKLASA